MTREARAAILIAPGEPALVERSTLDPPGPDEVRVRVVASGVCHTDLHVEQSGGWGLPFPILLGHEGAGYVEEVGPGVTGVVPGDAVVIAWRAPCGRCEACVRGDPRRCNAHLRAEWRGPPASHRAPPAPAPPPRAVTHRANVAAR